MPAISETRTEGIASGLLAMRGWKVNRPPHGNLLWKNEYRNFPHLLSALTGKGKKGKGGDAYPDFIIVDANATPVIVGELKAREGDIDEASYEASEIYGEALLESGQRVLAAAIAGTDESSIAIRISKRGLRKWEPVEYRSNPIKWLPTPDETGHLLRDVGLFDLKPSIPPIEILARTGEQINRALRECKISDSFRPAVMGAFMLAFVTDKHLRMDPEHVLADVNAACSKAFVRAGKAELADSLIVPVENAKLAVRSQEILRILGLLGVPLLTAEHDYLGQLYEHFFRYTGGNTIGQFFTPRHISGFMTDLCEVTRNDIVVDPTCGTGGFLISSLTRMLDGEPLSASALNERLARHLQGFETEPITAALCVANMILRGDGKTGVHKGDCFTDPTFPEGKATVVLGNPPFPHAKTDEPAERYVDRGLEALQIRGKLAMIVPASLLVKTTKSAWRSQVLKSNSLEAVITLPPELFQPYAAATTAVIVLRRGIPHSGNTRTFFAHIENDGFRIKKSTRIAQAGSQIPKVAESYFDGKSHAGLCTWSKLRRVAQGGEWAPGAYIEEGDHPSGALMQETDWLVRSLVAFHANHAPEIDHIHTRLEPALSRPYGEINARRRRVQTAHDNGTLGALFEIHYGQKALHSKENLAPGPNMVVSSSGMDNGCYGFFDFDDLISAPFVTVPSTGSIGEAFVQVLPCGVTDDCLILTPKSGTQMEDLFIAAAVLRLERWRFNYGRKATPGRIAHMRVDQNLELRHYIRSRRASSLSLMHQAQTVLSVGEMGLEVKVKRLAEEWRKETHFSSSLAKITSHPAYLKIIGLGSAAIPYVLHELKEHPGHWLTALEAITQGDNPAKDADGFEDARAAWLAWGEQKGYL